MCLTRSTHLICACLVDFVQFLAGANFVYGAFGVYFVVDIQFSHIQITITDQTTEQPANRRRISGRERRDDRKCVCGSQANNRTDNSFIQRGPCEGSKNRNTARGRERKPQYRIEIYPNTETAVTNGKKVALLKTNISLLNRNIIFMSVFPNQGASMLRVR